MKRIPLHKTLIYVCALSLFFSCAFFLSGVSKANGISGQPDMNAQFFSSMQDMPLKPGLVELTDQVVVFDKPEGRIIESIALVEQGTYHEIQAYYEETLPQLGWERVAERTYVRGNEHLYFKLGAHEGQDFLQMTLTPRQGPIR